MQSFSCENEVHIIMLFFMFIQKLIVLRLLLYFFLFSHSFIHSLKVFFPVCAFFFISTSLLVDCTFTEIESNVLYIFESNELKIEYNGAVCLFDCPFVCFSSATIYKT